MDVSLTEPVRTGLHVLQVLARQQAQATERLATGLKATSAVEAPLTFHTGSALNARAAKMLGLDVSEGLLVISVDAGSPAEAAGVLPYDVILEIDEQDVADSNAASALLRSRRPGETVVLRILRDGQEREMPMLLTGGA